MANKRKHRTMPERLYHSVVLPNGNLFDITPSEVTIAKIEEHSKEDKKD